jgi:hypothetical protein
MAMATYTISINERTTQGKSLLQLLKDLGAEIISEKEPEYDPEFVKMIHEQRKLPKVKIETKDLWK